MDTTSQSDLASLYAAAGIDPSVSTADAAEHLARLVAEHKDLAAAVERQTRLAKMSIDQGALEIDVIPTREVVVNWILAARDLLGDAENYSETPVELPAAVEMGIGTAGERYVVIVQRPNRLTPHEARRQAEADRDRIRDAVLALADELDLAAADLLDQAKTETDQVMGIKGTVSSARSTLAQRLREIAGQA